MKRKSFRFHSVFSPKVVPLLLRRLRTFYFILPLCYIWFLRGTSASVASGNDSSVRLIVLHVKNMDVGERSAAQRSMSHGGRQIFSKTAPLTSHCFSISPAEPG